MCLGIGWALILLQYVYLTCISDNNHSTDWRLYTIHVVTLSARQDRHMYTVRIDGLGSTSVKPADVDCISLIKEVTLIGEL